MRRNTATLRNLVRNKWLLLPFLNEALDSSANTAASCSNCSNSLLSLKPFFTSALILTATATPKFVLPQYFSLHRHISSSSSGPSNIVVIDSEEKFNSSLRKVQDEALPAILYFTAAWCGPCRLLAPIIGQLSEKYPQVTTYKIDIDQSHSPITRRTCRRDIRLPIRSAAVGHLFHDPNPKKGS